MEFFCRRFSVDTYRYRYRYHSFLKATGTTYFVCLPLVYLFFQSSGNAADFSGVLETIKFFFPVRTETNRNSICFGCFLVCFAKPKNIRFVSVFWTGIETNIIVSIQTETTRKVSKKRFLLGGSRIGKFFFLLLRLGLA